MYDAKNVLAPALDRPIGAVETVYLTVRVKRPEVPETSAYCYRITG
jgi:hypothetical protein